MSNEQNEKKKKQEQNKRYQGIIVLSITVLGLIIGAFVYVPPMLITPEQEFVQCLENNLNEDRVFVVVCENNTYEYCQTLWDMLEPYNENVNWIICETENGRQNICNDFIVFPQFVWIKDSILEVPKEGMVYSIKDLNEKMC